MNSLLDYLAARLQEPSTYVGLGSVFTGLGVAIAPEKWQAITTIGLGLGGLVATFLRERKPRTDAEVKEIVKDTVVSSAVQPKEKN